MVRFQMVVHYTITVGFCFLLANPRFVYSAPYGTSELSDEQVAHKCCGQQFAKCCLKSIRFHRSLGCHQMQLETRIAAIDCIQTELFGRSSMKQLTFTDATCCEVFANNDNDPRGECQTNCLNVMQIPTLRNEQKLDRIQTCMRRNPLFRCFKRCVDWSHTENSEFIFEEHCSWQHKMIPGKLYIGGEV
ncbi:hypothetical protein AB6A40_011217 [Gnathostoma spinigerum]|uniref:Uncharacterized protein n=1 Tax=Gnathostoma spinigerum TaxID=75299 RepID=A0ABD6F357_9BILA